MSAPLILKDSKNNLFHLDEEFSVSDSHSYWGEINSAFCGFFLKSNRIEVEFKRDIVVPKTQEIVTQGTYECAAAAYSMLAKIPLEEVIKCLYALGWKNDQNGIGTELLEKASKVLLNKDLIYDHSSSNDPCMIIVPSLNLKGNSHALYWNGEEMIDPQFYNQNKLHYSPLWNLNSIYRKSAKIKVS